MREDTFRIKPGGGGSKSTLARVRAHREQKRDCKYGPPEKMARRKRLESSPRKWLKYYLAEAFPLPFSSVHNEYIDDLEYIMKHGGWKAIAMPRGCGKTTIALGFALYALLTGGSFYLVVVSATATQGAANLASIKSWLMHNDRLAADYPEVCEPIRFTKGIPQAMSAITANGGPVEMKWTAKQMVFPVCPRLGDHGESFPALSASAVIECDGITGSLRGRKFDRPDGITARPDLVIPDDPQTDESAKSPEQCRARMNLIKSAIANMGGPGRDVKIILPCTIIENDDLADQATNPDANPDFLGQRHSFFHAMPENMPLWEDYNQVRIEGLAARDGGKSATRFYKQNRSEMDKGAQVAWPERHGDGAISGIQWGMNKYFILGVRAFQKEMQNSPIPEEEMIDLKAGRVLECETETAKWRIPFSHLHTIGFIDCNPRTSGLHWAVVAFGEKLAAQVLAYGRYPQKGSMVPKGASETQEDALLFEGLRKLCDGLRDREIAASAGGRAKLDLLMIDGGYKFAIVQQFCRQARYPFQLAVSRGRASSAYMDAGRDVVKAMSYIHLRKNPKGERYLSHNACALREIAQRAFLAGPDAPGGIGIHKSPPLHDEFAEQIASQRLTDKGQGTKGILYKWSLRPGGQDHWLDCIVGAYAGAHWFGIETAGEYSVRRHRSRSRRSSVTSIPI